MIRAALKALIAALSGLCLVLGTGLVTVHTLGISERVYAFCFDRFADTAAFRVEKEAYPDLARGLAAYLSGRTAEAQVFLLRDGHEAPAFNERELRHLEDVRALLRALRRFGVLLVATGTALLWALCRCGRASALRAGLTLLLLALCAFVLWALMDFTALFTAVHRLLFTNELWLMDPTRDLLIALMPQRMFTTLGAVTGVSMAAVFAVLWFLAGGGRHKHEG